MITILGRSTSNEQASSVITDLKNRHLITKGFIYSSHVNFDDSNIASITNCDEISSVINAKENSLINELLQDNNYVVLLQSHEDNYNTIKELAEGLHGIKQVIKV